MVNREINTIEDVCEEKKSFVRFWGGPSGLSPQGPIENEPLSWNFPRGPTEGFTPVAFVNFVDHVGSELRKLPVNGGRPIIVT